MDIRKSGLENSSGTQEKWYIFDDNNLVIGEFFLPKIWSDDFARFLKQRAADGAGLWACECDWVNDANNIQCVACGTPRR